MKNLKLLDDNIVRLNTKVDNLESNIDSTKNDMAKLLNNVLVDYHKTLILGGKPNLNHTDTINQIVLHNLGSEEKNKRKRSISGFLKNMVPFKSKKT